MSNTYRQGSGFLLNCEQLNIKREMTDDEYHDITGCDYRDAVTSAIDTKKYSDTLNEMLGDNTLRLNLQDGDKPTQDEVLLCAGLEPKDALWHAMYKELVTGFIGEAPSLRIDDDSLYTIRAGLYDLDKATLSYVLNVNGQYDGKKHTRVWNGYTFDDNLVFTGNTGMCFENDTFLLHAYDWGETYYGGLNVANFWYKPSNIVIDWYKYIGRGVTGNKQAMRCLSNGDFHNIIDACIESLDR